MKDAMFPASAGSIDQSTLSNPAAGAVWAYTVPANQVARILAFTCRFDADATVANRRFWFVIRIGAARYMYEMLHADAVVAGDTAYFRYSLGEPSSDRHVADGAGDYFFMHGLPNLFLPPGSIIYHAVENIQAGDQFGNLELTLQRWRDA